MRHRWSRRGARGGGRSQQRSLHSLDLAVSGHVCLGLSGRSFLRRRRHHWVSAASRASRLGVTPRCQSAPARQGRCRCSACCRLTALPPRTPSVESAQAMMESPPSPRRQPEHGSWAGPGCSAKAAAAEHRPTRSSQKCTCWTAAASQAHVPSHSPLPLRGCSACRATFRCTSTAVRRGDSTTAPTFFIIRHR